MARFANEQPPRPAMLPGQSSDDQSSTSLKPPSSSGGPVSLVFSLDDEKLGTSSVPDVEYDPVLEVQRIRQACTLGTTERKLFGAVQEAKASSILATGSVDLSHVGSYLRSKYGYLVCIRHANVAKRPKAYLRMLRHNYLVCRGLEGMEGVDVLIDLNFKDHFTLPHSTTWYAKLLAALPQDWIGSAAVLAPLVGLMSAGMRLCFKQAGIPLPPWREGRAVLSKWVPEVYEEEPLPLVPLPDQALRRLLAPYYTPFRLAVRTAAAGGGAAQGQQPAAGGLAAQHGEQQQRQQQQLAGAGSNRSHLPPLPRPPSGVALATASVKAAAADAAAGALLAQPGSQPGGAAALAGGHAPVVVPDVPRKIIVGFPDQQALPRASQHHQQRQQAHNSSECNLFSEGADAGAFLTRHQHQVQGSKPQWVADARTVRPSAVCGSAMTAVFAQHAAAAAQDGTVHRGKNAGGLHALPQPDAATVVAIAAAAGTGQAVSGVCAAACSNCAPAAAAAATAGCSVVVQVVPASGDVGGGKKDQEPQQQQRLPAQHAAARPAFTSTVGVVAATCGSSPGIVINRQWLQQQVGQRVAGAAGAAPAAASNGRSMAVTGAEQGENAAAAAEGAPRQFKTLDQLLPKMRTVRLGAA